MSIRCLGCMKLKEKSPVCEHCGYNENVPNYAHQLPIGTVLHRQYTVGKVLGQGGFGITYIGWDQNLDLAVAIKEYYPNGIVNRESTHSLSVSTSEFNTELYQHNRERFLREARALARLSNVPGIVGIYNFFPENNTAYIIMEYVEGIDLKRYIKAQGRPLTPEEAFAVLRPVMDSLSRVHEAGLVHRDISPDNIMIQRNGKAKLLDFGAVREVGDAQLDKNLSRSTESILKHGYAPIEQYQRRGNLGPWTDVYALCATVYFCLTQETPPDAPERMIEFAEVEWEEIPGLTEKQVQIFAQGMAIMPRDRYHSIAELRNALFPEAPEPKPEPKPLPKPVPEPEPEPEVALTVNAVVEATVISHITEQNQKKQEEILPEPKAVQISLEERRLQRKQEQLRLRQEKLEQQRKAQEEKQRREAELQEQRRLELEEKQRQEEARKERRRQEQLEKQLLEQEAKELRKKAQLEKQRREAELREKRRLEQEEKLHREEEQKEQRRQAQIRLQEEKRQRQIQEQKDKQEQLELRRQKRLEEKQRKEAESAGRSIHKILIPVLAVIAVMLTILLLIPKGEDGEQVQVKETVGQTLTPAETGISPDPYENPCRVRHLAEHAQSTNECYTYQSNTENNTLSIESENLSVTVKDNKNVTVTISGLDIRDSYLTNLPASLSGQLEYQWSVFFVGEETYSISTWADCREPGANVERTLGQMHHQLRTDNMGDWLSDDVTLVNWDSSSITWSCTIPAAYAFDFTTLEQVCVHVDHYAEGTGLCRVYNPATGAPAAPSATPCMDCGDWQEDSVMRSYQTETRNGSLFIEGENLSITVNSSNDVSVTVSGLDIRDSYSRNLSTTGKDMMEYGWHVTLHGDNAYRIGTSSWAFDPGSTETVTIGQMQNSLWDVQDDGSAQHITTHVEVLWNESSITWRYTIPSDHPFDFTKLKQVSVHVDNIPEEIHSCWVYNSATEAPAVSPDASCLECGDWREDSVVQTFQTRKDGSSLIMEGKNLSITVNGRNVVSVTVSGLDIQDAYPVNLSTTGKNTMEYQWHVILHGENTYRIGTSHVVYDLGRTENRSIDQMDNLLWFVEEDHSFYSLPTYVDVSWNKTSITWRYTIPQDHPFDFTKLKQVSVHVDNVPQGIYSCWVYNLGVEQAASEQVFAYMPAENPTYAEDAWKKNVMMEKALHGKDLHSSVTSVVFLDTIAQVPENRWDISRNQNGRVLAWLDGTVLYIGAEGGINAGESCKYLFTDWHKLKSIHNWNFYHTENTTSMFSMFDGCSALTQLDLSSLNTSKVTDMQLMFDDCSALTALDLSSFDTSKVTYMYSMFKGCSGLRELDLHNFQTGKVVDMTSMFQNCSNLKSLDLRSFNTSLVSGMGSMFLNCCSLTTLDLSSFQTGKVTRMTSLFQHCSSLTELDLSSFQTGNAYSFSSMFQGCSSLRSLDLSNFDTGNISSMEYMFDGCSNLAQLNISSFQTSNVYDMSYMFRGCRKLDNLNLSLWDTTKVLNYTGFMDKGKTINGRPWEEFFEK